MCFKLDRLGRSLSHLVQLVDEFATHRVALVVPSQGIDTSAKNPMAEMQLGTMAVFAQFERAIIVERVNAGLAAAKRRGVRLGRPRKVVNEYRDEVLRLRAQACTGRANRERAWHFEFECLQADCALLKRRLEPVVGRDCDLAPPASNKSLWEYCCGAGLGRRSRPSPVRGRAFAYGRAGKVEIIWLPVCMGLPAVPWSSWRCSGSLSAQKPF